MSRLEQAKKNIFWAILDKIAAILLPFITRTALIHYFGASYLGLNSLFCSILQVLSMADLGFESAIVYAMYRPLATGDDEKICALLRLYRTIYWITGTVIVFLGVAFLPFLPMVVKQDVPPELNIYILYMIYLLQAGMSYWFFSYTTSLFSASQRRDITSNITTIGSVVLSAFQLFAIIKLHNYYVYCLVIPFTTIVKNLWTGFLSKKMYPQYFCHGMLSKEETKDILKNVSGIFLNKISRVLQNSFDSIILSSFLGLIIVGKYNNYFLVVSSLTMFVNLVTTSVNPGIGDSVACESVEKNYKDFQIFHMLYTAIVSWTTACMIGMYQPFIKLWIGNSYLFPDSIMILFCIYFFTGQISEVCFSYRQASGLWKKDRLRPVISGFVNLCLNILLVKFLGVPGVMLSTIFCQIVIDMMWGSKILFENYFYKFSQWKYLKNVCAYAMDTAIICLVTYFVTRMNNNFFLRALLTAGTSTGMTVLCYSRHKIFREAMEFVLRLRNKSKKKR